MDVKPGDKIIVSDYSTTRTETVLATGRKYFTATRHGRSVRPEMWDPETGYLAGSGFSTPRFDTPGRAAGRERHAAAIERLAAAGLTVEWHRSRKLTAGQIEQLASLLESFGGEG